MNTNTSGLHIVTINGLEFTVSGSVTYNYKTEIYYCAGQSWPSEIVKEVLYYG